MREVGAVILTIGLLAAGWLLGWAVGPAFAVLPLLIGAAIVAARRQFGAVAGVAVAAYLIGTTVGTMVRLE